MFNSLINLFFPKVCAGCDALLLSDENVICTHCRHEIPKTNHHLNPENEAMVKCYGKIPVEFAAAFLYFHKKGIVQEMIHSLKYRQNEAIGTIIGNWYAADLQSLPVMGTVDAIIPVPLHPKKLKVRGYNQVATFGKALSENLDILYKEDLLVRKINSKTQTRKNLLGRSEVGKREILRCHIFRNWIIINITCSSMTYSRLAPLSKPAAGHCSKSRAPKSASFVWQCPILSEIILCK